MIRRVPTVILLCLAGLVSACGQTAGWPDAARALAAARAYHFTMTLDLGAGGVTRKEGDFILPDRVALTNQLSQGGQTFQETQVVVIGNDVWWRTGSAWSKMVSLPGAATAAAFANGLDLATLPQQLGQATVVSDLGDVTRDGRSVRHLRIQLPGNQKNVENGEVWVDPDTQNLQELRIHDLLPGNATAPAELAVIFSRFNDPQIQVQTPEQ